MRTNDARQVHKLVKQAAEEFAGAFYERAAGRDDRFYKEWPNVRIFIRKNWRNFVMAARQVLATMLRGEATSPHMKAEIYEALTMDARLPYSIQEHQVVTLPN
jgi:hypothetical protein